jgi:putative transposase
LQPVPWANQVLAINTATRPACRLAVRCSRDRQSPASPQQTAPQHELANERRRFGYRRLALMLKRDGLRMNLKRVYGSTRKNG